MGSYPDEFPFGIMEVVNLLNLRIRRQQANSVYVDCPFCGDRRGRMNVNFVKNVWRCNYCDAHGGMLALYAELNHTTTSDAYWEIAEALCDNIQEEHARSGNEAQQRPASPSPSTSGAWAAPAGHSSSERKTVPQSNKASPAEIHQTLSLLLAQLTLRPAHREHLRSPKRGLSDEQIDALGFKSTPPPFLCRSITERLIKQGCKVQGVPGFYQDNGGHWTIVQPALQQSSRRQEKVRTGWRWAGGAGKAFGTEGPSAWQRLRPQRKPEPSRKGRKSAQVSHRI